MVNKEPKEQFLGKFSDPLVEYNKAEGLNGTMTLELYLAKLNEIFEWHEEEFDGIAARVIQHEYDHIKGKLFVDYLSPLKKRLLKNKLVNISKGGANTKYRMRIPKK